MILAEITKEEKYSKEAFLFAEGNKANILREKRQEIKLMNSSGFKEIFERVLDGIEREIHSCRIDIDIAEEENNLEKIKIYEKKLSSLIMNRDRKKEYLEKEYPEYYTLKYKTDFYEVGDVQAHLRDDQVLVEYREDEKEIFVFTIIKNNYHVTTFPKDSQYMNLVSEFRELLIINIDDFKGYDTFVRTASKLYDLILKNSIDALDGTKKELIIIPDGELYNIPFAALLSSSFSGEERAKFSHNNLDYLIEEYALTYHYSSALMLEMQNHLGNEKNTFVGIAPVEEGLEESRSEINEVAEILGNSNSVLLELYQIKKYISYICKWERV